MAHFSNVHVHIRISNIDVCIHIHIRIQICIMRVILFVTYLPFVWLFFDHIRSPLFSCCSFFLHRSFIYFAKFHIFAWIRLRSQKVEIRMEQTMMETAILFEK